MDPLLIVNAPVGPTAKYENCQSFLKIFYLNLLIRFNIYRRLQRLNNMLIAKIMQITQRTLKFFINKEKNNFILE